MRGVHVPGASAPHPSAAASWPHCRLVLAIRAATVELATKGSRMTKLISAYVRAVVVGLVVIASVSGCACRAGHVGPYGGVNPTRCWVW